MTITHHNHSDPTPRRGLCEVHSAHVQLRGGFWGVRLETHHETTLPHALDHLEENGHVTNFDKAAGVFDGELQGHGAFDSDLFKALEGVMYMLQNCDDVELRERAEQTIDRILAAQQDDGFMIAYHIVKDLTKKWEGLRRGHQMYNAGHFFEMAVEHHRLTGDPRVLDAARRFAEHIDGVFGDGKRYDVDGHQEVELALVKLYRATGNERYLLLARFFLDERGYAHGTERTSFDPASDPAPVRPEGPLEGERRREFWHAQLRHRNGRMQDHKPIVDQYEAVGHAVRAGYMYAGMTDIIRFMPDSPGYEQALDDIWQDVVGRKMYVTGGIGSAQYHDEGFGAPYVLPNETAYCESCAAIAHVLWQYRMGLLKGQAKYFDVMELALYNGVLSGIAISGDAFSYENYLCSPAGEERRSWINLACCPTNLARILPQVGGLAYAKSSGRVYVNLFVAGTASIALDSGPSVMIRQETAYPWDGRVRLMVEPDGTAEFTLSIRVPGWATGRPVPSDLYRYADSGGAQVALRINGQEVAVQPEDDGYIHLAREWQAADVVELELAMPVRRVHAHPNVEADAGKVALMRGPIIYCLEAVDHPGHDVLSLGLAPDSEICADHCPDLLGGVTVLRGAALDADQRSVPLTAIPYNAWANRERAAMTVWVNCLPQRTRGKREH